MYSRPLFAVDLRHQMPSSLLPSEYKGKFTIRLSVKVNIFYDAFIVANQGSVSGVMKSVFQKHSKLHFDRVKIQNQHFATRIANLYLQYSFPKWRENGSTKDFNVDYFQGGLGALCFRFTQLLRVARLHNM